MQRNRHLTDGFILHHSFKQHYMYKVRNKTCHYVMIFIGMRQLYHVLQKRDLYRLYYL